MKERQKLRMHSEEKRRYFVTFCRPWFHQKSSADFFILSWMVLSTVKMFCNLLYSWISHVLIMTRTAFIEIQYWKRQRRKAKWKRIKRRQSHYRCWSSPWTKLSAASVSAAEVTVELSQQPVWASLATTSVLDRTCTNRPDASSFSEAESSVDAERDRRRQRRWKRTFAGYCQRLWWSFRRRNSSLEW